MTSRPRPMLRLVSDHRAVPSEAADWVWFCGHCAAPAPSDAPPAPNARVCAACGLGLLLETRRVAAPSPREAFLVVDSAFRVQALSSAAEKLLQLREQAAVDRSLRELVVHADAESPGWPLEELVAQTLADQERTCWTYVRPPNTYGLRMRARVAACGPPRAALLAFGTVRPVD